MKRNSVSFYVILEGIIMFDQDRRMPQIIQPVLKTLLALLSRLSIVIRSHLIELYLWRIFCLRFCLGRAVEPHNLPRQAREKKKKTTINSTIS